MGELRISLPDEQHARLKVLAWERKLSLRRLVLTVLSAYITVHEEDKSLTEDELNGI